MKKILIIIVLLIVVIFVGVYVGRNAIVKAVIESSVKSATGLDLIVGKVNIDFKNTKVGINQLQIKNPKGFEDALMLNVPEVLVNFELKELMNKVMHLEEVRLHIDQLVIVKNKEGVLNLSAFSMKQNEQGTSKPATKESVAKDEKTEAPIKSIKIDSVFIKLGKIVYKDYSQGTTPKIKEFNANIEETMQNVTDVAAVFAMIAQKAMLKIGMSDLIGFDVNQLKGQYQDEAQKALQDIQNEAEAVQKSFKFPVLK